MGGMVHIFNHNGGGGRHLTDHKIHPSLGIMNEEEMCSSELRIQSSSTSPTRGSRRIFACSKVG